MEFRVIIPARYGSKRLPGKALVKIGKKTMLRHVYDQCMKSGAINVIVATDDERIAEAASKFGATVCMTASEHSSGTERIAEAVVALGYEEDDIVVNVQSDDPLIPPSAIQQVAENLDRHDNIGMTTLCTPMSHTDELFSRDIVKVVKNRRSYALYFSRASIPWSRDDFPPEECQELGEQHFRHIGIYAYRVGFLQQYVQWESCPLERVESLEQLRVLWNGARIHVDVSKEPVPHGVDTPEQLETIKQLMLKQ